MLLENNLGSYSIYSPYPGQVRGLAKRDGPRVSFSLRFTRANKKALKLNPGLCTIHLSAKQSFVLVKKSRSLKCFNLIHMRHLYIFIASIPAQRSSSCPDDDHSSAYPLRS